MKYKKILRTVVALIVICIVFCLYPDSFDQPVPGEHTRVPGTVSGTRSSGNQAQIENLYRKRQSDVVVQVTAEVARLLPDDNDGSRHQKFILALDSGHTVLVSHNIDLAPRVQSLQRYDSVTVKGEYEWTERGGVIHWTHHDPAGRHEGGWIEHQGRRYD